MHCACDTARMERAAREDNGEATLAPSLSPPRGVLLPRGEGVGRGGEGELVARARAESESDAVSVTSSARVAFAPVIRGQLEQLSRPLFPPSILFFFVPFVNVAACEFARALFPWTQCGSRLSGSHAFARPVCGGGFQGAGIRWLCQVRLDNFVTVAPRTQDVTAPARECADFAANCSCAASGLRSGLHNYDCFHHPTHHQPFGVHYKTKVSLID